MPYSVQNWVDGAAGGTPISAARLNHIESGISAVDATSSTAVQSVTAGDATVTVAGTATAPTVKVGQIAESQVTNLTSDLAGKVTSVTAANNTVTVAGTATAPTVAVNTTTLDARYGTAAPAAPTGTASTDTASLQASLDAAYNAGGGIVKLQAAYTVTGVTINDGVTLDLNGYALTLANGANNYLVSTNSYASLIGTNSTSGPRDFAIRNGYLDGNGANQTDTTKPVLAIYGRRYTIDNLTVRNGAGTGIRSEWSTSSPYLAPNGFESLMTNFLVHDCVGHGIDFDGPHDTFFSTFYVIRCGQSAGFYPLYFADASGRANGSNVQQFHVYGGQGYTHGLLCNTAGMRFSNFVVEGAQTAQVIVQASQVMLDGFHLYTGGVNTAGAKGIQLGDATYNNVNTCTIRGRIENCGGGALDFTNAGDNNDIDVTHAYFSSVTPSLTSLGYVGTPKPTTKLRFHAIDAGTGSGNTFLPTSVVLNRQVGPQNINRANTSDTRDLWSVNDNLGNAQLRVDYRGRIRINNGQQVPTLAAGAGAGTGATASLTQASDVAGTISVTTGSTGAVAGTLATLTFSGVFGNAVKVAISPRSGPTAALQTYTAESTSSFSIKTDLAPAASTTYTWNYIVIGA